jgi:hypothetical protein
MKKITIKYYREKGGEIKFGEEGLPELLKNYFQKMIQ